MPPKTRIFCDILASRAAFFRWAGHRHLGHEHSPYSWNLFVDILGKNRLFEPMWDTVKSMHSQQLLSLATFASVFSSLAATPGGSPLKAFMDMPRYGMTRDTAALNSLLSALCRANRFDDARAAIPVAALRLARARMPTPTPSSSRAASLPPTCGLRARCSTKWCAPLALILTTCLPMTPSSLRWFQATPPRRHQKQWGT
ncbi:uncharacterized protein LOC100502163 [Zea mays]|uniref:Pentatricopeptide repeat-containing protein n=1 Tax=Zea mays TaxID=4577 RepID=C4J8V5_MAIZE|nr:uncharacterized protein LOC100502163 [Zea mays]ACR37605.1 unknown [Zea mays]|eukprot:NP_001183570.1 uncharacterized protein LOC100502163 [Zea mays]